MVSWIRLRFSIYQDFECIRNLNMLDFHWVYWQSSYYISGSEYARVLNLVWKQLWIQISRGSSKKQDMFEVHMTWSWILFIFWTVFISCEVLERVWEIMHHPRYCLDHHPGISSSITKATHFTTLPMPSLLEHKPPYPSWHVTQTSTSTT